MAIETERTGAYDAVVPITLPSGQVVYALATSLVDANGNPAGTAANPIQTTGGSTPGTGASAQQVQGNGANGSAPVGNPLVTAGVDAGTVTRRNLVGPTGGTVIGDAVQSNTMRVDTIGAHVFSKGGTTIATGQASVGTTNPATLVVAARTGRQKVTLTPTSSTVFYVGSSTAVTTATGLFVAAGASVTLDTAAAVYAIGSAALTVSFIEFY